MPFRENVSPCEVVKCEWLADVITRDGPRDWCGVGFRALALRVLTYRVFAEMKSG